MPRQVCWRGGNTPHTATLGGQVIDNLGFHVHADHHTELARLRKQIASLTRQVTDGAFYSYEAGWNASARLDRLTAQARILTREAAMEDQRIQRLADAVRIVGDPDLGFIAYVVFGPQAIPVETLYEVRLIDSDGYTVGVTIRTNLPLSRVDAARNRLMTVDAPAHARLWDRPLHDYHVQITPF